MMGVWTWVYSYSNCAAQLLLTMHSVGSYVISCTCISVCICSRASDNTIFVRSAFKIMQNNKLIKFSQHFKQEFSSPAVCDLALYEFLSLFCQTGQSTACLFPKNKTLEYFVFSPKVFHFRPELCTRVALTVTASYRRRSHAVWVEC